MDVALIEKVKKLVIIALASDDNLLENLVLKGGNAIELICKTHIMTRASYDLDYSIVNGDFKDLILIKDRMFNTLKQTFLENDYEILDFKFTEKPLKINEELSGFWGGYKVEFKIIEKSKYEKYIRNINEQRKYSITLHPNNSNVFELEFSKFEFIGQKAEVRLDGYKLYVYTPIMIVLEKLRAICQQLPQYKEIISSFSPRARARDFYDIYLIMQMHRFNPSSRENEELIKNIFAAKKVPTSYLHEIVNSKSFHKEDWVSVVDTVSSKVEIKDFDFYFDYVVNTFGDIKIL